jgi:hypothetical protein
MQEDEFLGSLTISLKTSRPEWLHTGRKASFETRPVTNGQLPNLSPPQKINQSLLLPVLSKK